MRPLPERRAVFLEFRALPRDPHVKRLKAPDISTQTGIRKQRRNSEITAAKQRDISGQNATISSDISDKNVTISESSPSFAERFMFCGSAHTRLRFRPFRLGLAWSSPCRAR